MENKIGIILGGGGGKGAYQVGIWRALDELGVSRLIKGVSGSSVGALNGAMFSADALHLAIRAWNGLSKEQILTPDGMDSNRVTAKKYHDKVSCNSLFSNAGLKHMIRRFVDLNAVKNSKILFYAAASRVKNLMAYNYIKNASGENIISSLVSAVFMNQLAWITDARYFKINGYAESAVEDILLASAAIPFIFPNVTIDGQVYIDGGIQDEVPIFPLYSSGFKKFFIVALDADYKIPLKKFPGAKFLDLSMREGDPFENLTGALDFTAQEARKRMRRGYERGLNMAGAIFDFIAL